MSKTFLAVQHGWPPEPWPTCDIVFIASNQYFAPSLLTHRNLSVFYRRVAAVLAGGASISPFFGPTTRSWLVPQPAFKQRADQAVARMRGPARNQMIGVHIRARFMLGRLYDQLARGENTTASSFANLFEQRFHSCVSKVRATLMASGSGTPHVRVYVAADSTDVREGARRVLGNAYVPPPSYLTNSIPSTADEISLGPRRSDAQSRAAFEELLILARADAIVVADMRTSTYSSVAASWFAHRAGGARERQPGLGVFLAANGCKRVAVNKVEAMGTL